jgi:hypothetical protein
MNDLSLASATETPETDAPDVAHAIALLSEGLLSESEFRAISGVEVRDVPQRLADIATLVQVQRASLRLRNSGTLARLEAARHAREAVNVAAGIMRDPDMHPSTRLNAATFIAKASGTERPPLDSDQSRERHTVVINIGGDRPPVVISSEPKQSIQTTDEN